MIVYRVLSIILFIPLVLIMVLLYGIDAAFGSALQIKLANKILGLQFNEKGEGASV